VISQSSGQALFIAHIVYSLDTGGLENGLVNLINRTQGDEFRHMVICLTVSGNFSERIVHDNVPIIELRKPAGHSLKTYCRLRRLIKKYRPDIIHSRNLAALESQIAGLGLRGIKRVHGEHGRDVNDLEGKNWKYNALRRLSRLWIDQYFAVSRELALWLASQIGVSKSRIVQRSNGVDSTIFHPREYASKVPEKMPHRFSRDPVKVVGTVGRLVAIKDQITLIRGFALVLKHLSDSPIELRLMIVGGGPLHSVLAAEAERLDVSSQVWFAGDRADVSDLLQWMHVFVLPSIAEGVSNTLLEAMATGLPVVSTGVGGASEIIESGLNGYLVDVGDYQNIAILIERLVLKPKLAEAIGREARATVEMKFGWSTAIEKYVEVYRRLVSRETKPRIESQLL